VLLMELRERGYTGGYTMLKMFAASLRPQRAGSAHQSLRDRAGRTDAGGLGGDPARQQPAIGIRGGAGLEPGHLVEFVTDERVETLIEAHEHAFLAFSGVPHEVLYDNMRTVVVERHGYGAVDTAFIPAFSTSPATVGSGPGCARRIGRRPRARWSGSSGICGRASTFRWRAGWPRKI
jgi:transposase